MFRKLPEVSIVLASYNHADFVREAIVSVLNQSVENIELIIVDDGSTDKTPQVIKQITDERIKFIGLKHNRAVNPRSVGIKESRGKFIAFQNSDDVWEPNKLEQQLKEFSKNPALSACFTKVKIISGTGKELKNNWANAQFEADNRPRTDWLRYFFDRGNCHCVSSAIVRRKTIEKVGLFDESLFQLSDFDLWVRCAAAGDLFVIQDKLTKMRIRGKQNISYPKDETVRRGAIEFAQALDRYSSPLFASSLCSAFADKISDASLSHALQLVYIIRYAWTLGGPHRLFADRLFARLISEPKNRVAISNHFGAEIIHEFIKKRGQLEVMVK